MPHLRLQVPEEWLREEFTRDTGFDAGKLLDHLVEQVLALRMENPAIEARRQEIRAALGDPDSEVSQDEAGRDALGKPIEPRMVPLINKVNLKSGILPVVHSAVAGDPTNGFLHVTFSAGNEKPGRTAAVRRRTAETLGHAVDAFVGDLAALASVTVEMLDIHRDRGYSTSAERRKRRGGPEDSA